MAVGPGGTTGESARESVYNWNPKLPAFSSLLFYVGFYLHISILFRISLF
jgi:hypothetical protein